MKKTILITGSTDGIGKLAALKLAKENHEVYIHGRNSEKVDATISEIKELTGNQGVKGFVGDLSEIDSVKTLAVQIKGELSTLDVLINNAGVFHSKPTHNTKGFDLRYMVNYLAPYILTKELLPLLKNTKDARVINLSSAAQDSVSISILEGKSKGSAGQTYAESKLALTMWSFKLAEETPDLIVIPVNPGSLQNTRMVREAYGRSWSSPDKGATILAELALNENVKNASGKYFDNDRGNFSMAHPDAYEEAKIDELIKVTEDILINE